jgi:hypothetical protein
MIKVFPLLIVLATIIIPMILAGRPRPKRQLRLLYVSMGVLMVIWTVLCLDVYPRYVLPE